MNPYVNKIGKVSTTGARRMKINLDFQPKLFTTLKTYNREKFVADLMAGIIVGIVALPLAIAFGIASGVSPEKGIITAIIGGFIVSMLGGSRVQIGGPTGAFIVIVAGIIAEHGVEGLAIATILAGVMLILMGVFKLGAVIRFIPYPVVVGFTSGIAITIFSTQIKDLLGLEVAGGVPSEFFAKWGAYFHSMDTINLWPLAIGVVSILIITLTPRISKKLPGSLIAILVITVIAYFLRNHLGISEIRTIGDQFTIEPTVPAPQGFHINMETINRLLPAAFTIAMLGAIESLLSATVADGVTGGRHKSNTELIAQGAANIVVPLFGGIPVTGAIARTMTNINNGGRTPVAGIVHSVVLLLILLFLSPLTRHIPMACLAGILIVVSYNMSEWRSIRSLLRGPKSDVAVLLTTLVLTVVFDLTIAIAAGLIMAVALFMKRVTESVNISVIRDRIDVKSDEDDSGAENNIEVADGVEVYEIDGPFFFGIANKFDDIMRRIGDKPLIRIIRMRKVPFIDSTGLNNLRNLIKSSRKEGITVILSGVTPQVRATLVSAGVDELVGKDNVCPNIHVAAGRANTLAANMGDKGRHGDRT